MCLFLAALTKVAASATYYLFFNSTSASGTGLAGLSVNLNGILEIAAFVVTIPIITEGGPPFLYAVLQYLDNSSSQAFNLSSGESAGRSVSFDSSCEKGFIRINIADPGNQVLIEQ